MRHLLILSLVVICPLASAQDMASSQQRGSEIAAFFQAGLPPDLHNELIQLSNQRDALNQRASQLNAEGQALSSSYSQWMSNNCQNISTQAQQNRCNDYREQAQAQARSISNRGQSQANNVMAFISAYENFKGRANAALQERIQNTSQNTSGESFTLAYQQGLTDGRGCYPSNAFGFCNRYSASEQNFCFDGYRQGFAAGEQIKTQALISAYEQGKRAAQSGQPNDSFNEEQASGSCRVQWIEAFNRGHFEAR
jgi:hypothetical protein